MKADEAKRIFNEVDELLRKSGNLIVAIDRVENNTERKELRRAYAELVATLEENFVFKICNDHPEFSHLKPSI